MLQGSDQYRAVFARIALVCGALSILTAAAIFVNDELVRLLDRPVRPREFALAWLAVFVLTTAATGVVLRRGSPDRLKLLLGHAAPFLLIPAAFTAWFLATGYLGGTEVELILVWIAFYGLLLLSTGWFAPRAVSLLGWCFLLTSLAVPVLEDAIDTWIGSVPTVLMGATFGLYHLLYAALNWTTRREPGGGSPSAGM